MNVEPLPFEQIIELLLDSETPFESDYLTHLSDLEGNNLTLFRNTWSNLPLPRRIALIEDIEELGAVDTVISFEELARITVLDPDAHVRQHSVQILSEYESVDLAHLFLRLLAEDQDEGVRGAAATGLGRYVYAGELGKISSDLLKNIEDRLIDCTRTGRTNLESQSALRSLGYSSRGEVFGLIDEAFYSSDSTWVSCSLDAMGRSADKRWSTRILEMLASNNPKIRSAAALASGELELKETVARLIELLDDPDNSVHLNSIRALSQIGGYQAQEKLEQMYNQALDNEEREILSEALENLEFWNELDELPFLEYLDENNDDDLTLSNPEDEWD